MSGHADDLGCAECVEAVDEGDADLDFGGLAVRVSCRDSAAGVVSAPAFPERPAIVACGAEGFVSGDCGRAVLFPGPLVLANRNDRGGLSVDDRRMASAGVIGAISGHRADLLTFRDLVQQLGQNRAITIAAGREL